MTDPASCKLCDIDHRRGSEECPARRIGTTVAGKYQIDALLGAGGMGAVYRAKHKTLGTGVAIKMVHAKFAANPDIAQRFEREAQHAAALKHPGIVVVSDLGRADDGTPYLEMELLAGRSVDDLVRAGELTASRAVELALQALDALAYAHGKGIVHRDIKPENLFVTEVEGREQLKVVDFGIAKALDSGLGMTQTGSLMGTPLYMSPEQLTDSKHVTPASDVYSMGAALFEMLTGTPPVKAGTLPEVMSKVLTGDITRQPSTLRGDLPAWVDDVVRRALARDPAERFASAKEMKEALLAARNAAPPAKRTDGATLGETVPPGSASTIAPNAPSIVPAKDAEIAATVVPDAPSTQPTTSALGAMLGKPVPVAPTAAPAPAAAPPVSVIDGAPKRSRVPVIAGVVVVGAGAAFLLIRGSSTPTAVDLAPHDAVQADAVAVDVVAVDAAPELPDGMVMIAGGTFEIGSSAAEIDAAFKLCRDTAGDGCKRDLYEREQPRHEVKVAPFFLDADEVTNQAVATWLTAELGKPGTSIHLLPSTDDLASTIELGGSQIIDARAMSLACSAKHKTCDVLAGRGRMPAAAISWHGAMRFCAAHGKRLPTEAEWELAARSPARRLFPWGERSPECDGVAFARGKGMPCAAKGDHAARIGASIMDTTPDGVNDLGGNVMEWVEDVFVARYACTKDCVDTPGRARAEDAVVERVTRGGYFDGAAESLRTAGRSRYKSDSKLENVGFRCAMSIPRTR